MLWDIHLTALSNTHATKRFDADLFPLSLRDVGTWITVNHDAMLANAQGKKKKLYLWHFEKFRLSKKGHTESSAVNMWFFSVPPEKNIFVLFLPDEQRLQPWVKKYFTSSVSSFHQSLLFTETSSLCSKRSGIDEGSSVLPKEDGRKTDLI